jgi:prefoldin subunit 5
MKNDLSIEALLNHLRSRRMALQAELAEVEHRVDELSGAIDELRVLEQQATSGAIGQSRLTCE